jgi:8-oxo-dGTP pyrophosphatase MutT (NUDIX family)
MADVLEFTTNPFGGVIPKPAALPGDPQVFRSTLADSLAAWRAKGFKVAWLEVPTAQAGLIPVAVEAGFSFHHTGQDYLMLTLRLVEGAFVPPYASHYIGAGGVVLNQRGELLVVCERHRATSALSFKLPGGALQPGEHLVDAVIREVLEETGVRTRFDALVCLRHWHGYRYGKSDIYFVCRLSPLSQDITMQTEEIEECQWMPVDRYLKADNVSPFNKNIVQAALESPGLAPITMDGFADPEKREFFMPRKDSHNDTSPLV